MKISIVTRTVLFSSLVVGAFFTWQGERFQKIAEWEDNNEDNVLCLDKKRGSRFGENDEVTPIQGKLVYVDEVLTFQQTGIITFNDLKDGDTFLVGGCLYVKRVAVNNAEGIVESNAYNYNGNGLVVWAPETVVEPRTVSINVE